MTELEMKIQAAQNHLDDLWYSFTSTGGATMEDIEREELELKNLKITFSIISSRRA